MRISEIEKRHEFITEHMTKCKCGHSVLITSKDGKELCNWCKRYVFASKEIEEKYRKEEFIKTLKREL